jgi:hypothetical protein
VSAGLPPHSVVNGISCKVETAEIWQSTDGIQYLNAPLNPSLELLAPANWRANLSSVGRVELYHWTKYHRRWRLIGVVNKI